MTIHCGSYDFELDASGYAFGLSPLASAGTFAVLDKAGETVYRSVLGEYDMPGELRVISAHVPNVYAADPSIADAYKLPTTSGRRIVLELRSLARSTNDTTSEIESYVPFKVGLVVHAPNTANVTDADLVEAVKILLGMLTTPDGTDADLEPVLHQLRSGVTDILG